MQDFATIRSMLDTRMAPPVPSYFEPTSNYSIHISTMNPIVGVVFFSSFSSTINLKLPIKHLIPRQQLRGLIPHFLLRIGTIPWGWPSPTGGNSSGILLEVWSDQYAPTSCWGSRAQPVNDLATIWETFFRQNPLPDLGYSCFFFWESIFLLVLNAGNFREWSTG